MVLFHAILEHIVSVKVQMLLEVNVFVMIPISPNAQTTVFTAPFLKV